MFAVPDRVEYLAYRERRHRMIADEFEAFLILRGRGIFQPEQAIRLEITREARRFDRAQAMMHVVQQLDVRSVILAQLFE